MGLPRLLFIKQIYTKPTFQFPKTLSKLPTKPCFNLIRTLSSATVKVPLFNEIINFVTNSPDVSVVPMLERYLEEDKSLLQDELPRIIRELLKLKRYARAHEIFEWTSRKSLHRKVDGDVALQLHLIGKLHGVDAAEKFFNEVGEQSQSMYGSLLNCYVHAKLVDKSLSHFNKMKEMGIATSSLTYICIMSLYQKTGQSEKILDLLLEMQDNGISPDEVSYRMCLKACALKSDFSSMDKLLNAMENLHHLKVDWFTYCTVANYYIEGGHPEKAMICLQKAEMVVQDNPVGYNNLISMYTKLGNVDEIVRLWQYKKDVSKKLSNADFMVMLSALVKLDKFQEADKLLEEWELSENVYDWQIPDILLMGYAQKGRVEKAEKLLEGMIGKNITPAPSSWGIISEGYVKRLNMQKAVQCMEKSLQLGPQHKGWVPKKAVISSILSWLGDHGDIEQVYEFLKLMGRIVPMNKNMYQALQNACNRQGKEINDILQRLKGHDKTFDEETCSIMAMKLAALL